MNLEHQETIDFTNLKLIPDEPSAQLQPPLDTFGHTLYSIVSDQLNQSPFSIRSILVSGDWGAGKTSVLSFLRQRIERLRTDIQVIFFEAWRYENEVNLMFTLLWQLVQQSGKYEQIKSQNENGLEKSYLKEAVDYLLPGVFKKLSGSSVKDLLENRQVLQKHRLRTETSQFLTDYVDTDKFLKAFQVLTQRLYPNKKLLIIIDDLDRCSPESGIDLLDRLRHVIYNTENEHSQSMFLVAMDKVTLKQAIRHKFADLSGYDSNRYLEKLFPLSLQLPEISVSLEDIPSCKELEKTERRKVDDIFKQDFFRNTRLLKRCLNQVYVYNLANTDEQISSVMLEWIAAINRWPLLREAVHKPDSFWTRINALFRAQSNDDMAVLSTIDDAEIEQFLAQPGIKAFLSQSIVFGSIFSETNLHQRIQAYANVDGLLRKSGI